MGKRPISFLTWNIYLGADLARLIPLPTRGRKSEVFRQFLATNFPIRAKAIARQIAAKKPDIIGLQEAVRWGLSIPEFGEVTYDFVEILLQELEKRGLRYEVAAQNENSFGEVPEKNGNTVSILDRDVILIRTQNRLKVIDKQEALFTTNQSFGRLVIGHGWSHIDVKADGEVFRVINTHLEPMNEYIRVAQATELRNGPANTSLPLVMMGDFNAAPGSETYNQIQSSGFHDTWLEAGEGAGLTSNQAPDLLNNESQLFERIDYIFLKNGWKTLKASLVAAEQKDRTPAGLWPSDHAGVYAKLELRSEGE